MVRIPRSEYARLTIGRKSIERVAELMRLSVRYVRQIELHGADCGPTATRLAGVTGADEKDYIAPRSIQISRSRWLELKKAAEPARRPYRPRRRKPE